MRVRLSAVPCFTFALGAVLYAACSGDSEASRTCNVNADCASGQCMANGKCAEPGSNEGGVDGGELSDADNKTDGDAGSANEGGPVGDSGVCTPNMDGIITNDEVPLRAGLKGTFKVTTSGVKVDTAGTASDAGVDGGGPRKWDFSGALTGDHTLILETMPLAGQWFEADYSGASYYARLSDSTDFLGIFKVTTGALELVGVVSPKSGSGQTKVKYDPTIPTLSFPLQVGKEWTVSSKADGDIPASFNTFYYEDYTFKVDAEGELKTSTALNPFKVMRINVLVKKTPYPYTLSYYTRQYVYVAECFGAVAKVVSDLDQYSPPDEDFTDAAEIQRLSP